MKTWSSRALPPEITAKLRKDFPPGSPASVLSSELLRQGFVVADAPCSKDPSIKGASINIPALVSTDAHIYWQADANGKLIWTAGRVWYTGP
jgi:hypothetical protein